MQPTDDDQLGSSAAGQPAEEPANLPMPQAPSPTNAPVQDHPADATAAPKLKSALDETPVPAPAAQTNPQSGPQAASQSAIKIPVIDLPVVAEDQDLIEQEWVDKAKAIVDSTKEDPHLQNKEISKFKADYIKKRYDKDIKLIEDEVEE